MSFATSFIGFLNWVIPPQDGVWSRVVPEEYASLLLCIGCFATLAKDINPHFDVWVGRYRNL